MSLISDPGKYLHEKNRETKMPFGKYDGKPLGKIWDENRDYFIWCLTNLYESDVKRRMHEIRAHEENGENNNENM